MCARALLLCKITAILVYMCNSFHTIAGDEAAAKKAERGHWYIEKENEEPFPSSKNTGKDTITYTQPQEKKAIEKETKRHICTRL